MADLGDAPLAGLRVLELGVGVACPYAGRLLSMLGAEVVKVEPDDGDPSRRQPIDDRPLSVDQPSPLFVHLNAGKRLAAREVVDLDRALAWADLVLDDRVLAQVEGGELDPATLGRRTNRPVVARLTAWGIGAEYPGRLGDELIVQAASGILTVTEQQFGTPVRFPGWQSQYLAGGYAVAGALVALGERAHEVEVTWVGSMLTAVEAALSGYLHAASQVVVDGVEPPPQRALQDGAFPSGPFRCADGHVVPGTVRPSDWTLQCHLYDRPDLAGDERFGWRTRWANRDALRAEIQPWYDERTKAEIFGAALDAGWAAAMVVTATDALEDPHLAERNFLSPVTGAASGRLAGRPWREASIAEGEPVELEAAGDSNRYASELAAADTDAGRALPAPPPMAGLKVVELTWAWAGPFVGRFLGGLGADVAHVETGSRPDGWRIPLRWKHTGLRVPDGAEPDDRTFDAAALFNSLNRNKRTVSIDLSTDEGREAFGALLDVADVFVVNMTASVLTDRGIEDAVTAAVDRGLVAITLPALGATGPFRGMAGYGTLTEGMGGFGARFGPADDGAGISTTYYPDCVAGLHASIAVLSGLARRRATGRGSLIDLSQQEATWLQLGEDLVAASIEGRDPGRLGNTEPGAATSGIFRAADDAWLAVVADDAASVPGGGDLETLRRWIAGRKTDDAIQELQTAGVAVQRVVTFDDGYRQGIFEERGLLDHVDHPVTGRRVYLSTPIEIDGVRIGTRRHAPMFDQQTDEILEEWIGASRADIARWRDAGGVGTVPPAHVPGRMT